MKAFNKIIIMVVVLLASIIVLGNMGLHYFVKGNSSRQHKVDVSRVAKDIEDNGYENLNTDDYDTIKGVYKLKLTDGVQKDFFD